MACTCSHENKDNPKPGSLAGSDVVGEPLIAIAEDDVRIARCGPCAPNVGGTPKILRFERVTAVEGAYQFETLKEVDLPRSLVKSYARANEATSANDSRNHSCLPWVRLSRDPNKFRSCLAVARSIGPITNASTVAKLVGDHLAIEDQEVFIVIMIDVQLHVRGISEIARGARDGVTVPVPDVLRISLVAGASGIVVVHNHPSSRVDPSEADRELTQTLAKGCKQVGITLLDHVILGAEGKYYSFSDHGIV